MRGNKEKEKSLHIQAAPTMPMPNSTASSFTVFLLPPISFNLSRLGLAAFFFFSSLKWSLKFSVSAAEG